MVLQAAAGSRLLRLTFQNIVDSPLQQVISALELHCESTREEVDCRLKAEKCAGKDELLKQELEERAKGFVHDIFDVDFGSRLCHPHPPARL